MPVPLNYIARNLWSRRLTTTLTAGGLALVVFVFATVLMLEEGLRKTLVDTGSHDNVVVIRRSSQTEVQSAVDRLQAALIESQRALKDALLEKAVAFDDVIKVGRTQLMDAVPIITSTATRRSNIDLSGCGAWAASPLDNKV